jgi:hypothetical protein
MMSTPLLPQTFWFRLAIPCRRVDGVPRPKGRLLDLPASCALPDTGTFAGASSWADVRAAWNASGLAVAVEVTGKLGPITRDPLGSAPGSSGSIRATPARSTALRGSATASSSRFALPTLG